MDQSGLSARDVDPTAPEFAGIALNLEFQRQLSPQYGLKLDKAPPVDRQARRPTPSTAWIKPCPAPS